jgi:hypothetical protein
METWSKRWCWGVRAFIAIIMVLAVACGGALPTESSERTLPNPLFTQDLPDPPAEVPLDKRLAVSVSECTVQGSDPPQKTPPGILMSQEMAMRAARVRVAYDEVRGLYEVDLRTMDRERQVYDRHLKAADDEIVEWRVKARRSWWEKNRGLVGLSLGLVVGVGLTIGVVAALDGVTDSVE